MREVALWVEDVPVAEAQLERASTHPLQRLSQPITVADEGMDSRVQQLLLPEDRDWIASFVKPLWSQQQKPEERPKNC